MKVFMDHPEDNEILSSSQKGMEHFFGEGISHVEAKDYDYRGRGQCPGVFTVQPSLDTYDKGKDEAEEETDNGEHQYKIGGDNVFASGPINPPPDLYTYVEGGGLSGIDATYICRCNSRPEKGNSMRSPTKFLPKLKAINGCFCSNFVLFSQQLRNCSLSLNQTFIPKTTL
nr:uncharacterized protein LOC113714255 [Coffea arabica]